MSASDEAKEIIRRWNEEGWSGGKYELAHEIISPNMQVHGAGGQAVGMGPDGLIDLIKTWRTAFPDGRMEIDDLIVEGDTVAIRNTWYGTQAAEFYGIPPSGKKVAVTSVGIDRVQDGLVTEGWGELDMIGMMQQMGALPIVGPGAVAAGGDPTWGADRSSAGARGSSGREPRDPARASSRRWRTPTPARPASSSTSARSSTTAPAGARATSTRCSTIAARAARGDARPALRARHDVHGQRGRPGRRALRRARHAHGRGRSTAPSRRATSSSGRTATSCGSAAARSSSAGRRPTC